MPGSNPLDEVHAAPGATDAAQHKLSRKQRKRAAQEQEQQSPGLAADPAAYQKAVQRRVEDKLDLRHKTLILVAILVVLGGLSSCIGVTANQYTNQGLPVELYSPLDVLSCYAMWIKINIGGFFWPAFAVGSTNVVTQLPMYYEVTTRVIYIITSIICGVMLSVSGMLYQNVFRNPIAAPTMLGVSSGIQLGCLLLVVMLGGEAVATSNNWLRIVFSLLGGLVVLLLVMGAGKAASGKRRGLNLVDMLLVATMLTTMVNAIINYVTNYVFTAELWEVYYDLTNVTEMDTTAIGMVVLIVVAVVSFIPVYLYRFQLNGIAFSDETIRLLGINASFLRLVALGCGSIMIIVAQTYMGTVSLVSLVVPFISRGLFGSEFRRQMVGNVLLGAILLLFCRDIVSLIPFVGDGVPVGTVVTFVLLPAFAWVTAMAQKQWRD